jgi:hypothetical protein
MGDFRKSALLIFINIHNSDEFMSIIGMYSSFSAGYLVVNNRSYFFTLLLAFSLF